MAKKRVHRPEGSRPVAPTPARTSTPSTGRPGRPRPAGPPPSRRQRFEDASQPIVERMAALPTFVLPLVLAVMVFLGLALPSGWAGLFLLAITVFLTWITALAWPTVSPGSKVLRVVVDLALLAVAVLKMMGRF